MEYIYGLISYSQFNSSLVQDTVGTSYSIDLCSRDRITKSLRQRSRVATRKQQGPTVLSRSQNCCSVNEADFSCGGRLFQHVGQDTLSNSIPFQYTVQSSDEQATTGTMSDQSGVWNLDEKEKIALNALHHNIVASMPGGVQHTAGGPESGPPGVSIRPAKPTRPICNMRTTSRNFVGAGDVDIIHGLLQSAMVRFIALW